MLTGGLDEVGWGALAGPVISVVTVFKESDLKLLPSGVRDSKKVSEKKRNELFGSLCVIPHDIGVGHAWPKELDEDPYKALQLSYQRAIEELRVKPDLLYMDGSNKVQSWKGNQIAEPKADLKYREVSAASIIAKVFRDRLMESMSKRYPEYRWAVNKGYGTSDHIEAIRKYGLVLPGTKGEYIHRQHFCRNITRGK